MDWQILVTTAVVAGAAAYAVWSLLPRSLLRRVSAWRGKPQPAGDAACGGCDGCGGGAVPPAGPPRETVIRIVKRPPAG